MVTPSKCKVLEVLTAEFLDGYWVGQNSVRKETYLSALSKQVSVQVTTAMSVTEPDK